jgi:hypothetical protein
MASDETRFPPWPIDERVFAALTKGYRRLYPSGEGGTTELARQIRDIAKARKGVSLDLSHAAVQQVLSGQSKSSWIVPYLAEALGVPPFAVIPEVREEEAVVIAAVRMVGEDRPDRLAGFVADVYQRAIDITGRAYASPDDELEASPPPAGRDERP